MILELSENSGNVMLNALGSTMNGGSIELLDDHQRVLATLSLSVPAAAPASDGALTLNEIYEDVAPVTGTATFARVLGADGSEVLTCDVGDEESDATIKLTPQKITAGVPVRIQSFKLAMP